MTGRDVIIRGGTVLVGAPRAGKFEQADVRVRDGLIAEIGLGLDAAGAQLLDADGRYVLPGFVDAHHHLWEASLRGVCSDGSFADFFYRIRVNHAGIHTPEDLAAGIAAGALAAIDAGTTTVVDHLHAVNSPDHADAGLEAVLESGLRARWCYGTSGGPVPVPVFNSQHERWDDARRVRSSAFSAQQDGDRVTMGLAIADVGTYGWDESPTDYHLADELDVMITSHANCFWGPSHPAEFAALHARGLLGPRQLYSHANASTDEELALLADAGVSVVSTPETEMQLGIGFPILSRAARAGVKHGIGVDIQANNSADMFSQMRLGMHACSALAHQPMLERTGSAGIEDPVVSTREIYHTATLGGAEAVGLDHITGSIAVGKAADLVLLRHDGLHQTPNIDPFATIVQQSGPRDVDLVMVAGEIIKQGGRLPTERVRVAHEGVTAAFERLCARAQERGGLRPPVPEGLFGQIADAVNHNVS